MAVRLSSLRAGCPLPRGRFLVLICVWGWVDPRAIMRLEGLGQLKKSSDLIGIRNRDLTACSIMPQPTTLPRVDIKLNKIRYISSALQHSTQQAEAKATRSTHLKVRKLTTTSSLIYWYEIWVIEGSDWGSRTDDSQIIRWTQISSSGRILK
jgi:hypothetical protein